MTPSRYARMRAVLAQRLRTVTVVLEDVCDPHNISAVLRSCDAFGVQHVHVVNHGKKLTPNPAVSHRCEKWLDIHEWDTVADCFAALHQAGFVTCAMSVSPTAKPVQSVAVDTPIALVFGNEHRGVSADVAAACTHTVVIPMFGFVESFNISVAAAVALAHVTDRMRAADAHGMYLSDQEQAVILSRWVERHARGGE